MAAHPGDSARIPKAGTVCVNVNGSRVKHKTLFYEHPLVLPHSLQR